MPSIFCFDSHGVFLRRLPLNVKNISVGDYCMIGSSPVPPYGPITALGVLFEWLVGLRTDVPLCFAF